MNLEDLVPHVAQWLGIQPSTALFFLMVIVSGSNVVSRLIPEDATGFLHFVRVVTKFIGLHVTNRVTGNLTLNDAATLILKDQGVAVDPAKVQQVEQKISDVRAADAVDAENADNARLFPGFKAGDQPRDATGKFLKKET